MSEIQFKLKKANSSLVFFVKVKRGLRDWFAKADFPQWIDKHGSDWLGLSIPINEDSRLAKNEMRFRCEKALGYKLQIVDSKSGKDEGEDRQKELRLIQNVVSGLNDLTPEFFNSVYKEMQKQCFKLRQKEAKSLFSSHKLTKAEQSMIGIMMLQRSLQDLQEGLEDSKQKHQTTFSESDILSIRTEKCLAVVEQLEAIQRGE